LSVSPPPRSPLLVASIVATAFFMEQLDSTIIVLALPQMAESFGRNPVDLSLGITAYMLTLAVVIPASGWIADRLGARNVFCSAIALFTVASVLCGFADSLGGFVAARILQGIGGAMMSPVGRLVVLHSTEKKDLVRAINFLTVPGLIGPVVGPPLGGFITTFASWRWIFFVNIPIGLIGIALAFYFVHNRRGAEPRPFDAAGFVLNGAAVACLMYGMDLIAGTEWLAGAALIASGAVFGWFAVRHALRTPHPLVDLKALRIKTYAVTMWGGSLFRMAIAAPTFLLPLFLQVGLGMSAFVAGLLVLSHTGGDLLAKTFTTWTVRRMGFRPILIWTAILFSAFTVACALFTSATPLWLILGILFVGGIFRSLQMTGQNALQFADINPADLTAASTLASVMQQVVRGLGVAIAAVILNLAVILRDGPAGTLTETDFRIAFAVNAVVAFASLLWYLSLPSGVAAHVSGGSRTNK
jgi:EmrB/QacA subfamily drug resistance transporter